MAKSDARFEYKADLSRTDHDLSQPFTFTSAPGMLLPIWCDIASPGDSYYMQHDMPLLRSNVLAAPSMVDVKVHYETFFVPMQMIYQPFENTMFSLANFQSSNYLGNTPLNNDFPLLNYSDCIDEIVFLGGSMRADAFRIADLLGLCPVNMCTGNPDYASKYKPNFFPWQLLAYQTIFQYYFRLDDKSSFTQQYCNFDRFYHSATVTPTGGSATIYELFRIHQRPWDFDYFTSMYRSPIVSNANLQSMTTNQVPSDLFPSFSIYGINSSGVQPGVDNSSVNSVSRDAGVSYDRFISNASNSPAIIRSMFANEKLAMITGRTRKNYDSQVLAHYGVSVPHDVKHDLTMIHHDEYDLNVMEVTSLASTSDAPLGELAGKSYASGNGKSFKFTAPCHGVMMTIFSVEPKKKYQAQFERINSITNAFDLPTPEFDRLGNVPMYRYECGFSSSSATETNTDIIGWKERYYQFKRKPARATYAFNINSTGTNPYSAYALAPNPFARIALNGATQVGRPGSEETFYIDRSAMDPLCLVSFYTLWYESETGENWSNSPHLVYARDPFIVDSHIKAKKVSWMSKDGEPVYPF